MKLGSRICIVGFTLGSCALAAFLQLQENAGFAEPKPFELFDTVQTQLRAIRTQRYQQAYLQASSQYMDTNDLDRFIESARGTHSVIRQAVRWEFGILSVEGNLAEVPVQFFLHNGESVPATYRLVRETRAWKIDSVELGEAEQTRTTAGLRM
jgi:cation transport regulator ChaB